MSDKARPIGVTIVGILYLIMSLIAFLGALGYLAWAGLFSGIDLPAPPIWLQWGGNALLSFLGLAIFLMAIIDLLISIGCFRGWGWVWSWALFLCILNILFAMFNAFSMGFTLNAVWIGLMGSIIPIVVLFYLNTSKVKDWFGKLKAKA
jgi:hypothetical protein